MNSREIINETNYGHLLEKPAIVAIANGVSSNLDRPIKTNEANQLFNYIKDLDLTRFKGLEKRRVFAQIADEYYEKLTKPKNTEPIEIHEHLKNEIMHTSANEHQYKWTAHHDRIGESTINAGFGNSEKSEDSENSENSENSGTKSKLSSYLLSTLTKISTSLNPEYINNIFERARSSIPGLQTYDNITFPRTRITLDSRNKVASSPNKFFWYLNPNKANRNAGAIKLNDTLCEIISIKTNQFWLPMQNPLDFYYSSVFMNIKEISQNVVSTEFTGEYEDKSYVSNHHFEFHIKDFVDGKALLEPINAEYKLSKPLAQLNTISLEFRAPFQEIEFLQDRGIFTANYGNPTLYTLVSGSHNLSTGDLVYIMKSNLSNSISQEITKNKGHFITRINSQEISISLDTSAFAGTENNITIFYGNRRLITSLEFTSLQH